MSEYYIEIEEELTEENEFRPREIIRKYVKDEIDAELVYKEEILKFNNKLTKASFIQMNHAKDSKDNKPCISKEIKDGKVQS